VCTEDPEEAAESDKSWGSSLWSSLAADRLPLVASGLAGADAVRLSLPARAWPARTEEGNRTGGATWRAAGYGERCGDRDRMRRPRGRSPDMPAASADMRSEAARYEAWAGESSWDLPPDSPDSSFCAALLESSF
jgi:hypothetical protein